MGDLFFDQSEFPNAEIAWNSLESDFNPADEEFTRDVLLVRFPNACMLDVEWRGELSGPQVGFLISLVQTGGDWEPFKDVRCPDLNHLRRVVHSCAEEAAARPSIRRHLSVEWSLHSPFSEPHVDKLVLDPLAPLASQLDALGGQLFVGLRGNQDLIVSWEPAHSASGCFVVRTYRPDWTSPAANGATDDESYPRPWWVVDREWLCATTSELRQRVEAIDADWRRDDS